MNHKKVAYFTLGCKLNFSETSTIARGFTERNFKRVDFTEPADIYVINTCTVTEAADKKCRNAINRAIRTSPDAYVVVVGCYSQINSAEIAAIEGVDLILGSNDKFKLFDFLENLEKQAKPQIHTCDNEGFTSFLPSYSTSERTRSFLKVQDGCDYQCSYCTIPLARGKSRSESIQNIVNQANRIASEGFKEIVLTGVNVGDFGNNSDENFYNLICELENVQGIERYRISSIEPNLLTDKIIDFVAHSKKFMPHYHIPLQSGCNRILGLMRRRYQRELFADKILKIKQLIPNAFIGVDVIVGFPTETDEDFAQTVDFLINIDFSQLHVFTYSERENTEAIKLNPKVNPKVKALRSKALHELSNQKLLHFYQQNLQKTYSVLFESKKQNGKMLGFTENYIKVEIDYNKQFINNIINNIKLIEINSDGNINGEIIN